MYVHPLLHTSSWSSAQWFKPRDNPENCSCESLKSYNFTFLYYVYKLLFMRERKHSWKRKFTLLRMVIIDLLMEAGPL
jgi:hypothetical protein